MTKTELMPCRDWHEDATHENGNYQCQCADCKSMFIGHKRRVVCKLCAAGYTHTRPDPELAEVKTTLETTRKRLEYLAALSKNDAHHLSNEKDYFPLIDSALAILDRKIGGA